MNADNRRLNIADEVEAGDAALLAAELLRQSGFLRDAASRLYYACYHSAVALLLTEGIEPRTHAGVQSLLGLHFVRSGKLSPEHAHDYADIQRYRELSDYGRGFVPSRARLDEDFARGRVFIDAARRLLDDGGWLTASGS